MNTTQTISATPANVSRSTWPRLPWKLLIGICIATTCSAGIWLGLPELSVHARLAFITFTLAVLGWIFTDINDTVIALAAALVFTVAGIDEPTEFFGALGDPLIWLMLTSFIIAAGVTTVGLSTRLAVAVAARTHSVNQLFYSLSLVMIVTAFFIPATSGRAALMLPVFLALSKGINNSRISRALALLFPTIILLSAVASLIGAGAHLVTADLVARMGGETLNFLRWTMLGLPFAVASCLTSTWIILRMFLRADERRQPLQLAASQLVPNDPKKPLTITGPLARKEWYVIGVVTTLVGLWSTQPLHGLDNALVALLGALAITLPTVGVIDFKDALKSVEWNMLIFMAATLELGEALIESGGAQWLVEQSFTAFSASLGASALAVVSAVTIISLLSHLVINSRTARSSVLVPLVILLGVSLGYNPVTLAFLSTAAAGFCLTLPVSAKPVTMFGKVDVPTYSPNDLLKLSGVLLPVHFGLLVGFALWVWPWLGLDLKRTVTDTPPVAPTWEDVQWKILIAQIAERENGRTAGESVPNAVCLHQNCVELPKPLQQMGLLESLRKSGLAEDITEQLRHTPPGSNRAADKPSSDDVSQDAPADKAPNSAAGNNFIDQNGNGVHDALDPRPVEPATPNPGYNQPTPATIPTATEQPDDKADDRGDDKNENTNDDASDEVNDDEGKKEEKTDDQHDGNAGQPIAPAMPIIQPQQDTQPAAAPDDATPDEGVHDDPSQASHLSSRGDDDDDDDMPEADQQSQPAANPENNQAQHVPLPPLPPIAQPVGPPSLPIAEEDDDEETAAPQPPPAPPSAPVEQSPAPPADNSSNGGGDDNNSDDNNSGDSDDDDEQHDNHQVETQQAPPPPPPPPPADHSNDGGDDDGGGSDDDGGDDDAGDDD